MPRGFRRRDGRIARRETEWFGVGSVTDFTSLAASTISLDASLSATGKAFRPFTITRTVGLLHVISDQEAADENALGAIGAMVPQDAAVTIGVTALPNPMTAAGNDSFFLHQYWVCPLRFASAVGFDARPGWQYTLDSRAQRKVTAEEDVVFIIANAGTTGMRYYWQLRMLIKLH